MINLIKYTLSEHFLTASYVADIYNPYDTWLAYNKKKHFHQTNENDYAEFVRLTNSLEFMRLTNMND